MCRTVGLTSWRRSWKKDSRLQPRLEEAFISQTSSSRQGTSAGHLDCALRKASQIVPGSTDISIFDAIATINDRRCQFVDIFENRFGLWDSLHS
jgi:hypothetical protein